MTHLPKTLIEAVRYFSDLSVCHEYMRKIKWPAGKITCPRCGGERIGKIAARDDTTSSTNRSMKRWRRTRNGSRPRRPPDGFF